MTDRAAGHAQQLVQNLGSANAAERIRTRAELAKLGRAAVPVLLSALDAPRQHVRWEAAKTLAEIADPAAAQRLVASLGDEDTDVRWVVAVALISVGSAALRPLLTTLTKSEPPEGLYPGAHHVLHDLAKQQDLAALLRPVLSTFHEPEPAVSVPLAAAKALKEMKV